MHSGAAGSLSFRKMTKIHKKVDFLELIYFEVFVQIETQPGIHMLFRMSNFA